MLVTEIPYGVSIDDAVDELIRRSRAERPEQLTRRYSDDLPRPTAHSPALIVDIRDHSAARQGIRIVCTLRADAGAEAALAWVLSTPSLSRVVEALLPAPIRTVIAEWGSVDHSGLQALAELVI